MFNTYSRILETMDASDQYIQKIFSWISLSVHPITINELKMILELDPDSIGYDPAVAILDPIKDLLRWSCRGLVEIKDDRVQFIHFTVKEYSVSEKRSPFYVDKVEANGDITTICLTYLTFATTPDFTKGVTAEAGLDMVIDNLWIPILGVLRTTDPTIIARKDPPYLQNSTIDRT
ncbi:MAG: hypothetical protein M1830_003112 [Pleopsidium flavum]|nr:MAG: hypothetical protein M1830_003112 [Pleopsidium flavum]